MIRLAPTPLLEVGSFVGEYRIECRIGQGGMGEVYGAIHPTIGKRAAVKVLRREVCTEPESIERFVLEARAVNQIGHPNIVDIFGFGALPDGRQYMVMEWLRGESLDERIARGPLEITEVCDILLGVCAALDAAHHARIVHRDLKPQNIFLVDVHGEKPLVKLLDFGLVKLTGSEEERLERTRTGSLLGTPAYLSPEQARGVGVDHRSDLYSLGVVAFELLTGQLPFPAATAIELLVAHLQSRPPPASSLRQGIPVQLDALILALLAKEPNERPSLYALKKVLVYVKTGVAPPMPAVEATQIVARPRRTALLVLPLLAAVVVGVVVFFVITRAVRHEPRVAVPAAADAGVVEIDGRVLDARVVGPAISIDAGVIEPDATKAPRIRPRPAGRPAATDASVAPPDAAPVLVRPDASRRRNVDDDGLLPMDGQ